MKYVIGNWKANKNLTETASWFDIFLSKDFTAVQGKVEIIICPPFPFLLYAKDRVQKFPFIKIGAQNISHFDSGPHTGEVSAANLKGVVSYSLIGHSERREFFNETDEHLIKKTDLALNCGITPLYCIRGESDVIPPSVQFVVFEPVSAIGTGQNVPVEEIVIIKNNIHLTADQKFVYGGSVSAGNVRSYLENPYIDGILPGGASLDPEEFYAIIQTIH